MPNETNPQTQNPKVNPNSSGTPQHGETGLLDLLVVLGARIRLITRCALAGGVLAATAGFILPDTYTASTLIMPPQQPQTIASSLIGQLGPLASAAGRDLGLKNPAELYIGLLASRTISDHLIARFDLKRLYKAKTMVDARRKLKAHTHSSAGKDSLIRLDVEDTDPRRAAEIANAYAQELNLQNTALATTEASQRRMFLERQLEQEKASLTSAEEAMKRTQAKTGIVQVESQASAAIGSIAQLKAQIAASEVALQRLKMAATPQNPAVLRAEAELQALRSQLKDMEGGPRSSGDPLVATSAMPEAGMEYLRCLRDLKYHEFLFEMLSKQYEAARIDEDKVAPSLQVIDQAVPPDKKSGPHRGLLILFGTLASLTFTCIFVYIQNGLREPDTAEKLRYLRSHLFSHHRRKDMLPEVK